MIAFHRVKSIMLVLHICIAYTAKIELLKYTNVLVIAVQGFNNQLVVQDTYIQHHSYFVLKHVRPIKLQFPVFLATVLTNQ